eukprot:scaffold1217_cov62-Phaeocystis_antarctica.AAC.3
MGKGQGVTAAVDGNGLHEPRSKMVRQPGVEPGSLAWEARMITATLLALRMPDCIIKHILTRRKETVTPSHGVGQRPPFFRPRPLKP